MTHHICQSCEKNQATVHLTEIIGGKKRELHYCEACAQKEGISPLTPQSFFPHLVDVAKGVTGGMEDVRCPKCGLSYSEFRQRGRLGCEEDYKLFKEGLSQLLDRIHGSTQHIGKVPSRLGDHMNVERELIELQRELTRVIQREEYEQAARVRDQIRELEERTNSGSE